jgi:hypothetical protein
MSWHSLKSVLSYVMGGGKEPETWTVAFISEA